MLEKLLNEIRDGGTLQPASLAVRLNTSVSMVEVMLADLEERGLLAQVTTNCSQPCGGCPLIGECTVTSPQGRMWVLFRKQAAHS